jgi:hypothetical protein
VSRSRAPVAELIERHLGAEVKSSARYQLNRKINFIYSLGIILDTDLVKLFHYFPSPQYDISAGSQVKLPILKAFGIDTLVLLLLRNGAGHRVVRIRILVELPPAKAARVPIRHYFKILGTYLSCFGLGTQLLRY